MPTVFRVAVFLCDTPLPTVVATEGDYGAIFDRLLRSSLPPESALDFSLDAYDVRNDMVYPKDVAEYDAIILTGSVTIAGSHSEIGELLHAIMDADNRSLLFFGDHQWTEYPNSVRFTLAWRTFNASSLTVANVHGLHVPAAASAYENLEWINRLIEYIASVAKEHPKIRLFGICFGHQIIGRALGGECVPNEGKWEVGVTEVELTALGRRVFGVDRLNLEQMHRDHVPEVPSGLHLLGSTAVAKNQGMVQLYPGASEAEPSLADIHILTVQGHPEFYRRITENIVKARNATGVLSAEIAADYERRAYWRNDGVGVVGKTMWDIMRASRT